MPLKRLCWQAREMIGKLRQEAGGDAIPVSLGDFAGVAVDGAFDLIFLVAAIAVGV